MANQEQDNSSARETKHFQIVIVGGGNGGISVAAQLLRANSNLNIGIIEPSATHYYQPIWTLVGGGVLPKEPSARPQASVIPKGATWLQDSITELDPENNRVRTAGGEYIGYDFLVVSVGIELNWGAVKGLEGAVGKNNICSNYTYETVDYTWETIQRTKSGNAIFTIPGSPIKCAGAPQKIMYLADESFRKAGVRDTINIEYVAGTPGVFGVPEYAKTLNEVIARKGIKTRYSHELVEIRPEAHEAVFEDRANGNEQYVVSYDMIHVTPFQRAPKVVRESVLANEGGWLEVDKLTLQSPRFANVFALGDASSLPTSKTGAAIRKQAPVLVKNLLEAIADKKGNAHYDGYTACPLVTGYGKLVMAEFDYDKKPQMTFKPLVDQTQESWSMYQVKRHLLPWLYWNRILTGKA